MVSHLFFYIQETNCDDTEVNVVNVYVCMYVTCTAIKKYENRDISLNFGIPCATVCTL